MEGCTITIDGYGEFHYPCNYSEYITNDFINTGSSTIYLYKEYGSNSTVYPRIVMPGNSFPYYQTSYNSSQYITNAPAFTLNWVGNWYRERQVLNSMVGVFLIFFVVWRVTHK